MKTIGDFRLEKIWMILPQKNSNRETAQAWLYTAQCTHQITFSTISQFSSGVVVLHCWWGKPCLFVIESQSQLWADRVQSCLLQPARICSSSLRSHKVSCFKAGIWKVAFKWDILWEVAKIPMHNFKPKRRVHQTNALSGVRALSCFCWVEFLSRLHSHYFCTALSQLGLPAPAGYQAVNNNPACALPFVTFKRSMTAPVVWTIRNQLWPKIVFSMSKVNGCAPIFSLSDLWVLSRVL